MSISLAGLAVAVLCITGAGELTATNEIGATPWEQFEQPSAVAAINSQEELLRVTSGIIALSEDIGTIRTARYLRIVDDGAGDLERPSFRRASEILARLKRVMEFLATRADVPSDVVSVVIEHLQKAQRNAISAPLLGAGNIVVANALSNVAAILTFRLLKMEGGDLERLMQMIAEMRSDVIYKQEVLSTILHDEVGIIPMKTDRSACDLLAQAVHSAGLCDAEVSQRLYDHGIDGLLTLMMNSTGNIRDWLVWERQMDEVRPLIFAFDISYAARLNALSQFALRLRAHPPKNANDINEYMNAFNTTFSEFERVVLIGKPSSEDDRRGRLLRVMQQSSQCASDGGRGLLSAFLNLPVAERGKEHKKP